MKGNLLFMSLVIIAGILLSELVLWVFFPVYEIDGRFGDLRVAERNVDLPGVKSRIIYDQNRFGFRSLSMRTLEKPPHTVRILCLGHSTTDQPTQSTSDIWSALLETKLQNVFGPKGVRIEVAARGVGGEGVKDNFYWARGNILKYHPDLVVLLEGINDLAWGPRKIIPVIKDNSASPEYVAPWKITLGQYSQIYRRLVILKYKIKYHDLNKKGGGLDWHSENLPKLRKGYRTIPIVKVPQLYPGELEGFSEHMYSLLELLKEDHLPVVVLGQPVLWKTSMTDDEMNVLWFPIMTPSGYVRTSTAEFENEMAQFNKVQNRLADAFGDPYVDLDKEIPKDLQYYFDDCHFTDLGNSKVADVIFPVVEQQVEKILDKRHDT